VTHYRFFERLVAEHFRITGGKLGALWRIRTRKFG
jgi:hypothetical protein